MRYFITDKKHNVIPNSGMKVIGTKHIPKMIASLGKLDIIPFDTETNGLDPYLNKIVLLVFSDNKHDYVIDRDSLGDISFIFEHLRHKQLIGHNIKYDIKMVYNDCGFLITNVYDTMIVDQRLYMGLEYRNAIDDLMFRYLRKLPDGMVDGVPNEWIGKDPKTFKFKNHHIDYSAADTCKLLALREKQLPAIIKYRMEFLINGVEFPLIKEVALAELEGAYLNTVKLKAVVDENLHKKYEIELKLDRLFREVRDGDYVSLSERDLQWIKGGKYDRPRKEREPIRQHNLFNAETDDTYLNASKGNINWNSSSQLIYILGRLKQPVPTDIYKYIIPSFLSNGKLKKMPFSFTTQGDSIEEYLIDNLDSPVKELLETVLEYRGIIKELSTYGLNLIDSINPITGKIHTTYRQCHAENGRFQSGGGKKEPDKINSQNIPRDNKYRTLFSAGENYDVLTCDLAGAELTIMAAQANDTKLFDIGTKGDIHGYLATLGWRAVYRSRAMLEEANNHIISKTVNKDKRQKFKNVTFATVYNVGDRKAGKIIGISKDEGKIIKSVVRREFPDTFDMVDRYSLRAQKYGYLVFNKRTNSRGWFPKIVEALRAGNKDEDGFAILEHYKDQSDADGKARNAPISGTQADMVKEAIVEIGRKRDANNWDIGLIFQIHDEVVYRIPKGELGKQIAEEIRSTLCEVANRYLEGLIKMDATATIEQTWIKD